MESMENRTPLSPLTSSQHDVSGRGLDFSKVTPSEFGISVLSFTAHPKEKEKSRVAALKARRRSSIGVRGSPETNSLICYRAKQAMKTPPSTPQHLLASPLLSGRNSIKQKMAAFQRLMGMDEEENIERAAVLMKEEVGETSSQNVQSGDLSEEDQENLLPGSVRSPAAPPHPKRRRGFPSNRGSWRGGAQDDPLSEPRPTSTQEEQTNPSEFRSPMPPPDLGPCSQSQLMSSPMLSKPALIRSGDAELHPASKKRVRFGAPLSPEFFDKTLPPSTPLQKGATPAPPPSSTGRKRSSLLKTPQRFDPPLPQPDFSSPSRNGASPVLASHDPPDRRAQISFPNMDDEEDDDPPATGHARPEGPPHHQSPAADPEPMNAAFHLEDEGPSLTAGDTPPPEPRLHPEPAAPRPRAPRGRKRKQPAGTPTEARRSSRSAAAATKGKLKTSRTKNKFGTKEVDRSLYGRREYASKNPLLSPILESNSLGSASLQLHAGPDISTDAVATIQPGDSAQSGATAGLVAAAAMWRIRFLERPDHAQPAAAAKTSRGRRGRSGFRRRSGDARPKEAPSPPPEERRTAPDGEGTEPAGSQEEPREGAPGCEISRQAECEEETRRQGEIPLITDERSRAGGPNHRARGSSRVEIDQDGGAGPERACPGEGGHPKPDTDAQASGEATTRGPEPEPTTSEPLLEPWQLPDFNIEDVLRPAGHARASVRRSLRNRASRDVRGEGLAWVDHTSPQNHRRRTRGRLSGVSNPEILNKLGL